MKEISNNSRRILQSLIVISHIARTLPLIAMFNNQILRAFLPFHGFLVAYSSSEFYRKDRRTLFINIFRAAVFSIFLFGLLTYIITSLQYCFDSKNNLKELALPTSMTICTVQVMLNYISIASKSRQILELIGRVQRNVNYRRLNLININNRKYIKKIVI